MEFMKKQSKKMVDFVDVEYELQEFETKDGDTIVCVGYNDNSYILRHGLAQGSFDIVADFLDGECVFDYIKDGYTLANVYGE